MELQCVPFLMLKHIAILSRKQGTKEKMNSDVQPNMKAEKVFLVLPSHAEKHKINIQRVIETEKEKLRKDSYFRSIFKDIQCAVAFTNDKNIKN